MSWEKLPSDPLELRAYLQRESEEGILATLAEARAAIEADPEMTPEDVAAALPAIERRLRELAAAEIERIVRRSTH
jgi:signal transduction histidine kinase